MLIASLIIQLLALGTPLFTQVIIDKVVVHRTQSTLIVIGIGLSVFMVFSALLSWVRQYLILHTGNRVDAVLGAAVFDHLFKLPTCYFEHRPTGVIAARLHGVEIYMLRLVGLWQQFQQANLSVQRMDDIMNAPMEPYSIFPSRLREGRGQIDIYRSPAAGISDRNWRLRAH